jgi:hypothetical protein
MNRYFQYLKTSRSMLFLIIHFPVSIFNCLFMRIIFIFGLSFLLACQETPKLDNFDNARWIKDRLACNDKRKDLIPSLEKQIEKLKGLGQNQILSILGKPDFHELHERNQRFYIYFFEKGEQCNTKMTTVDIKAKKTLKLRFSALDRVTEITLLR